MKLPLLISLPHAGLGVPAELEQWAILSREEIARDGDEGAAEIYSGLEAVVARFVTTDIARAFVDLNRAPDDFRKDGVVKTHTCWDVPVYRTPLEPSVVSDVLRRYYDPYHEALSGVAAERDRIRLGVDCHTMADEGPPVGPDPGKKRPMVCLGDGGGVCPADWFDGLVNSFERSFSGFEVTRNVPFGGGHITRHHGREMPWVQVELSRSGELADGDKHLRVKEALVRFCEQEFSS